MKSHFSPSFVSLFFSIHLSSLPPSLITSYHPHHTNIGRKVFCLCGSLKERSLTICTLSYCPIRRLSKREEVETHLFRKDRQQIGMKQREVEQIDIVQEREQAHAHHIHRIGTQHMRIDTEHMRIGTHHKKIDTEEGRGPARHRGVDITRTDTRIRAKADTDHFVFLMQLKARTCSIECSTHISFSFSELKETEQHTSTASH